MTTSTPTPTSPEVFGSNKFFPQKGDCSGNMAEGAGSASKSPDKIVNCFSGTHTVSDRDGAVTVSGHQFATSGDEPSLRARPRRLSEKPVERSYNKPESIAKRRHTKDGVRPRPTELKLDLSKVNRTEKSATDTIVDAIRLSMSEKKYKSEGQPVETGLGLHKLYQVNLNNAVADSVTAADASGIAGSLGKKKIFVHPLYLSKTSIREKESKGTSQKLLADTPSELLQPGKSEQPVVKGSSQAGNGQVNDADEIWPCEFWELVDQLDITRVIALSSCSLYPSYLPDEDKRERTFINGYQIKILREEPISLLQGTKDPKVKESCLPNSKQLELRLTIPDRHKESDARETKGAGKKDKIIIVDQIYCLGDSAPLSVTVRQDGKRRLHQMYDGLSSVKSEDEFTGINSLSISGKNISKADRSEKLIEMNDCASEAGTLRNDTAPLNDQEVAEIVVSMLDTIVSRLSEGNGNIQIHCEGGMHRSPSLVVMNQLKTLAKIKGEGGLTKGNINEKIASLVQRIRCQRHEPECINNTALKNITDYALHLIEHSESANKPADILAGEKKRKCESAEPVVMDNLFAGRKKPYLEKLMDTVAEG